MKVIKKISVFFLVCLLCFSSVFFSYEKANNCEAVSVAVFIGSVVLGVGALCYGAYYVSQPDNQELIKESLTNYADMTVENAKFCYETNKKVFSDFVAYATKKSGGSAAVYTATGEKFTVDEMAEYGFPDFGDWDKHMKKQGSTWGASLWDKLSFGVDLLDFICDFFEDDEYSGSSGSADEQSYFHGDDDYIDRETGEVNIFYYTRAFFSEWSYSDHMWYRLYKNFYGDINGTVAEQYKEDFRFALYCSSCHGIPYVGEEEFEEYPIDYNSPMLFFKMGNSSISSMGLSYIENGSKTFTRLSDGELKNINYYDMYITCKVNNPGNAIMSNNISDIMNATNYSDYVYLSANVPLFATSEEAVHYIETGDYSNALNLAPELQPTPTSVPIAEKDSAVAVYCNYFSGRSVTPSDVVNINYTIGTDWDGTPTNLTTIINNYYNVGTTENYPQVAPTATLIPTLPNEDGSNTTNNYIINITNILQPIQETVTNIYNFFVIDTEEVGSAFNDINVLPTGKFDNFVSTFSNLSNTFSDNVQEECSDGQYGIKYPVIKVQCPKILLDFVPDDSSVVVFEDGICYLVLADCIKFAKYFVMVRAFLKACIWIGMIFYLMKELKPVITLSD